METLYPASEIIYCTLEHPISTESADFNYYYPISTISSAYYHRFSRNAPEILQLNTVLRRLSIHLWRLSTILQSILFWLNLLLLIIVVLYLLSQVYSIIDFQEMHWRSCKWTQCSRDSTYLWKLPTSRDYLSSVITYLWRLPTFRASYSDWIW